MPNHNLLFNQQQKKNAQLLKNKNFKTHDQIFNFVTDQSPSRRITITPNIISALNLNDSSLTKRILFFLILATQIQGVLANSSLQKQNALNEVCNAKYPTFNKPDFKVKLIHGLMYGPASCIDDISQTDEQRNICSQEIKTYNNFRAAQLEKEEPDELQLARLNQREDLNAWVKFLDVNSYADFLETDEQKKILEKYLTLLFDIKTVMGDANNLFTLNGGNCGEHCSNVFMKLLRAKIKYGFEIKLQMVTLYDTDEGNHCFVVVDGNNPIVNIKEDLQATNQYVRKLQGTIYDSWNNFCGSVADDKCNLYDAPKFWHGVKVQEFDFNISELKKLPRPAQALICGELQSQREFKSIKNAFFPNDVCDKTLEQESKALRESNPRGYPRWNSRYS